MPDEPLYDPDRDVPEDLDLTNPDIVSAYLYHPATKKLIDDLGRSVSSMPADRQRRLLSDCLSEFAGRRAQCAAAIDNLDPD